MPCNNAVPINNMTDVWNATGNFRVAIQMDVSDISSAANSRLLDLLINSVSQFAVDKNGCIITACPTVWIQNASQDGFGINGGDPAIYIANNPILNFDGNSIFPTTTQNMDLGTTTNVFRNIYQVTESTGFPTTAQYPNDNAWGMHDDTLGNIRYLTFNNAGSIETIQFGARPVAGYDEGSLLISSADGFNFSGAGVTATLVGSTVVVDIPGSTGGGGSGNPLAVFNDLTLLHPDVVQITFTGLGVTATNVGNLVTVDIPGATGSSFTGVVTNSTLNGDGNTIALSVAISSDSGNIITTGTDGGLYAFESGNPLQVLSAGSSLTLATQSIDFSGAGVNVTNVGNNIFVDIPGATSFTGAITNSSITGDGSVNPLSVFLSVDGNNAVIFGSDGGVYTPALGGFDEGVFLGTNITGIDVVGVGASASLSGQILTINVPGGTGAFVGVISDNTLTGDGSSTNLGINFSTDVGNIATTGSDGALFVPTESGNLLQILSEGSGLTNNAASIDFTGAGVTVTNVGNDVVVNIPGGASFTGVTSDDTINGDGAGVPLSVHISTGINNIVTTGVDGGIYSPATPIAVFNDTVLLNSDITQITFTGSGVVATNVGSVITVNIPGGSGGSPFAGVTTTNTINGDGLLTPLDVNFSTDLNNLATTGSDGALFVPSGNYFTGVLTDSSISGDGLTVPLSVNIPTGSFLTNVDTFLPVTGNGINTVGLLISADIGNITTTGSDGGVFTPSINSFTGVVTDSSITGNGFNTLLGISPSVTGSFITDVNTLLPVTGNGTSNPVGLLISADANNIVATGSDGGVYSPATPIAVFNDTILLSSDITQITFTGSGVVATNVGSVITVNIPGGSGGSPFAGVTTDNTINGDGLVTPLGVNFSSDVGNIATTGSDGAVYVPTVNSFTGVNTLLPITGDGDTNPVGLLISTDPGNLTSIGGDGGVFTSLSGNFATTGYYYYGRTQSGFVPTTGDLFFADANYIEEDPFGMSDNIGTLTIQKNGRYLIDVDGSMDNTTASGYVELLHNGSPIARNYPRDLGGSVQGLTFGLTASRTMSSGDSLVLRHNNSGVYNDVMLRVNEQLDVLNFYGNFSGSPISFLDDSILLTPDVTSINLSGNNLLGTNIGGAVTIAVTGVNVNLANSNLTQTQSIRDYIAGATNHQLRFRDLEGFYIFSTGNNDALNFIAQYNRIQLGRTSQFASHSPRITLENNIDEVRLGGNVIAIHSKNPNAAPPFAPTGEVPELRIYNGYRSSNPVFDSNYVGFKTTSPSGSLIQSVTYTLPTGDGSNNQVLTTNGAGQLLWTTPSAAGGPDTNFGNTDLTYSGNRTHNASNFSTQITNSNSFTILTQGVFNGLTLNSGTQVFGALFGSDPSLTLSRNFGTATIVGTGGVDLITQIPNNPANIKIWDGVTTGNYVGFTVPSTLAGNTMYTLPTGDGNINQVLSTNGSGQLSWQSVTGAVSDTNLFNTNLTLLTSRTHDLNNNTIIFNNGSYFVFNTGFNGVFSDASTTNIGMGGFFTSPRIVVSVTGNNIFAQGEYLRLDGSVPDAMELQFRSSNTGSIIEYVGFKAPPIVPVNTIWTLPSGDGSNNQVLTTDGAGQLSWSNGANAERSFTDAELDLGLVPLRVSDTSGTATANRIALNNFFATTGLDVRKKQLVLPGEGYGVDQTILIPRKTGFSIICNGATDLRGDNEYGAVGLGGPASRLVRIGNDTGIMLSDESLGLCVQGTLVLEGYYEPVRANKLAYLLNASNPRPRIGFLSAGNPDAGLGSGKQRIQGLTVIGCDVGLQFVDTFLSSGTSGVAVNNADNSTFDNYYSLFNRVGLKFVGQQAVSNVFGFYYSYINDIAVQIGQGGAFDNGASAKNKFEQIAVVGNFLSNTRTVIDVVSTTRNSALMSIDSMVIDAGISGVKIVDMPNNGKLRPIHIHIKDCHVSYNGTGPDFDRGMLRDNATLVLDNCYWLEDGMFGMVSTGLATPNLVIRDSRFADGHSPATIVNAAASTGNRNIRWYGCQEHSGSGIFDGQIII